MKGRHRLASVPTYVWNYPTVVAGEQLAQVDSPPETNPAVRKALAKYTSAPRKAKGSQKAPTSIVGQAVRRVSLQRPRRDATGANARKKNMRKMKIAMGRAKKRVSRNATRRRADTKLDTMKRQPNVGECSAGDTLLEKLMNHVTQPIRGKRVSTHALVERISKIGASPSAGGSRAAIAIILTHVGEYFRAKRLIPHTR